MRYEKLRKEKERENRAKESHKIWLLEKEKQLKIDKEKKLKDEIISTNKEV